MNPLVREAIAGALYHVEELDRWLQPLLEELEENELLRDWANFRHDLRNSLQSHEDE